MKTIVDKNTGKEIAISDESYEALFPQKNKRWKPDFGNRYHYVLHGGSIAERVWTNHRRDEWCYHTHNVFKTEQEVQEKLKAIKKKYEIINRIEELNDGWEPDWDNPIVKYNLGYQHQKPSFWLAKNYYGHQEQPNEFYFKSKEIGGQLISEFEDDLKYLFIL